MLHQNRRKSGFGKRCVYIAIGSVLISFVLFNLFYMVYVLSDDGTASKDAVVPGKTKAPASTVNKMESSVVIPPDEQQQTPPPVAVKEQPPPVVVTTPPASTAVATADGYNDDAAAFVVRRNEYNAQLKGTRACSPGENSERCSCKAVIFIGGMKCGSTNLATRLKHDVDHIDRWDPNSGFVDAGKEVCAFTGGGGSMFWRKIPGCSTTCAPGHVKKAALDACPYYTSEGSARSASCAFPSAKYLFLIRNPIDRLISHCNENRIRRGQRGINCNDWVLKRAQSRSGQEFALSNFGATLRNFLSYVDPSQIMIVRTEKMKGPPDEVQALMDTIRDFLGLHRKPSIPTTTYVHSGDRDYQVPSKETLRKVVEIFQTYNEELFKLIGFRFTWKYFDYGLDD